MARRVRRPGNLPAETTSFIGRRHELAELRKKLAEARLVSLVGPGGVGKSRLALRAATELGRGFADGVWLVELADLRDPAMVGNVVMAALDLRDQAATEPLPLLLSYVRDRELLLVVDNCEHLLDATAQLVTEVLRAAPAVRVIATSREPLSAPGEHVLPVPPLDLPSGQAGESLNQLRQNEAVMLFMERAAAASGSFELTASNQVAVAQLCRRLDGLPLAIELAAVRTRVLTTEQILDRLSDRFGLLTRGGRAALPRHQTLQTTIEWSHDLLAPGERTLLRRLSVFAGRFTLEDVEAVCSDDDVQEAARPVLQRAVAAARQARQSVWLSHSLSMASIAENMAGDGASARRLLHQAESVTAALDDLPTRLSILQARALNGFFVGDLDAVRSASSEGVRLSREAGDLYTLEIWLMNLGLAALSAGELDESKPLLTEALQIAHDIDDRAAQFALVGALGCYAAAAGEARLAAQLLGASAHLQAQVGADVNAIMAPLFSRAKASATAALGPSKFDAEFESGSRYSRDAAIGLALGESVGVAVATPQDGGSGLLGKREAEVARLVADGLSNKQIGSRLFISERTVESHVRSILNKLGCATFVLPAAMQ